MKPCCAALMVILSVASASAQAPAAPVLEGRAVQAFLWGLSSAPRHVEKLLGR